MSLATIRTNLKEAVDTTGLRTYDYLPGSPALPCAVIGWPTSFEPHAGFGDVPNMEIPVTVMVPFQSNRSADANLEQYLTTSGSLSVVAAIEAGNHASIRLHQRLGFEQAGLMPEVGTKFGRWLDLAFLQLRLDDGAAR